MSAVTKDPDLTNLYSLVGETIYPSYDRILKTPDDRKRKGVPFPAYDALVLEILISFFTSVFAGIFTSVLLDKWKKKGEMERSEKERLLKEYLRFRHEKEKKPAITFNIGNLTIIVSGELQRNGWSEADAIKDAEELIEKLSAEFLRR
jgi:hypothetical protein